MGSSNGRESMKREDIIAASTLQIPLRVTSPLKLKLFLPRFCAVAQILEDKVQAFRKTMANEIVQENHCVCVFSGF